MLIRSTMAIRWKVLSGREQLGTLVRPTVDHDRKKEGGPVIAKVIMVGKGRE